MARAGELQDAGTTPAEGSRVPPGSAGVGTTTLGSRQG